MDAKCIAVTKDGRPCSAGPVRPSGYCYWHDPALLEQRRTDRQRGGAARSNVARARKQIAGAVLSPSDIQGLLGATLRAVIAGRIEPGIGNAAANLARALIAVREATEIETRLAALEEQAGRQGQNGRVA
jgi:hypothetical protein